VATQVNPHPGRVWPPRLLRGGGDSAASGRVPRPASAAPSRPARANQL